VRWEEGEVLGHTYPATILPLIPEDDTDEEQGDTVESQVRAIQLTESADPQRVQQLLEILGVEQLDLSPSDKAQLSDLVEEFADVFALDDSELGCTSLVQHRVDTGDYPAIKQLPRRMPFSQRRWQSWLRICWKRGSFGLLQVHGQVPLCWSQSGMVVSDFV